MFVFLYCYLYFLCCFLRLFFCTGIYSLFFMSVFLYRYLYAVFISVFLKRYLWLYAILMSVFLHWYLYAFCIGIFMIFNVYVLLMLAINCSCPVLLYVIANASNSHTWFSTKDETFRTT